MDRLQECAVQTNVRGFVSGGVAEGWLVLRLPKVRDGVFVFSAWGVSATPLVWWSQHTEGTWSQRNSELLIDGVAVTAPGVLQTDKYGNVTGPTIARVPMQQKGTVEVALRMLRGGYPLSHLLWR